MLEDLLLVLSIRFFLFDFILFKKIRIRLKKYYIFKKLFTCTFCQGFWCGLLVKILNWQLLPLISLLKFAFISAIVAFTWTVTFHTLIKIFEADNELPMT